MNPSKLATLMFLLLALPAVLQAQFIFTTNNGAITITQYTGPGGAATIPATTNGLPVTSIGNSAFYDCSSLTNVTIPDGITNIDVQAFTGCGLTSVAIPDSVINIGQSAFLGCSSLAGLSLGHAVVSIGDDAFDRCLDLTNVYLPPSVTNLVGTAFNECSALTNLMADPQNPVYSTLNGVLFDKQQLTLIDYPAGLTGSYTIPSSVTSIGRFAFTLCDNLTAIVIPSGVTNIGEYAFYGCDLANIALPANLINLGIYALAGCANLTAITLPGSLTTIGDDAFSGIRLTSITIPASVTNLGPGVFDGCPNLTAINVAADNPAYASVAGVLFDSSQTSLIEFPFGRADNYFKPASYVIPGGVTTIGASAFAGCYLAQITLPAGSINIGSEAFAGCFTLTNLAIPDGVISIGDGAFMGTGLTSLTLPASVSTLGSLGQWSALRSLYFQGDAPGEGPGIHLILYAGNATAYYLPGTAGWGATFQTIPTAPWLPQVPTGDGSFGVRTNQFGFNFNWAGGQTVVVEACTNLSSPNWQPVQTNTLTTGTAYFNDPQWTNYARRYYRLCSP